MNVNCVYCSKSIELRSDLKVFRSDSCDHCGRSIRTCKMCKHYDLNSYNQCKESSAERVVDKDVANFCDFFIIGPNTGSASQKNDILSAAEALFKKRN